MDIVFEGRPDELTEEALHRIYPEGVETPEPAEAVVQAVAVAPVVPAAPARPKATLMPQQQQFTLEKT